MGTVRVTRAAVAGMASSLNLLAGAWLIISPFVLDFGLVHTPMWNAVIVGIVVAVFAATRAYLPHRAVGLSWLDVALGIWLIVSPFVLRYTSVPAAMNNALIVGVIICLFGLWSALETHPMSHRTA